VIIGTTSSLRSEDTLLSCKSQSVTTCLTHVQRTYCFPVSHSLSLHVSLMFKDMRTCWSPANHNLSLHVSLMFKGHNAFLQVTVCHYRSHSCSEDILLSCQSQSVTTCLTHVQRTCFPASHGVSLHVSLMSKGHVFLQVTVCHYMSHSCPKEILLSCKSQSVTTCLTHVQITYWFPACHSLSLHV
jgi:hypothetical protein